MLRKALGSLALALGALAGAAEKLVYNSYISGGVWEEKDRAIVKLFSSLNPDIQVEHSIVAHKDGGGRIWARN